MIPMNASFVAIFGSIVFWHSAIRLAIAYAANGAAAAPVNGSNARRKIFERRNASVSNVVSTIAIASERSLIWMAERSARLAVAVGTACLACLEFGIRYVIGVVSSRGIGLVAWRVNISGNVCGRCRRLCS